jgi:hypothetical protein
LSRRDSEANAAEGSLNVGENLRGSQGHENEAERRAKPKNGDAPTREQAMTDFKAQWLG